MALTVHGITWWTTDTVEHQGAIGLRGGVYTTTQYRKETCSDTSVQAERAIRHAAASDPTQTYYDKA
eukprot:5427014-Pyramimonas_sp.AAC.1